MKRLLTTAVFLAVIGVFLPFSLNASTDPVTLVSDTTNEFFDSVTSTWKAAVLAKVHDSWPGIPGAKWIWDRDIVSGSQRRLGATIEFRRSFELPEARSGTLQITADNEVTARLNGTEIIKTGCDFETLENTQDCIVSVPIEGVAGSNEFTFTVVNFAKPNSNPGENPAGFIYKAVFDTAIAPDEPEPVVVIPGMLASISPVGTFSNLASNFWVFTPFSRAYYSALMHQFEIAGFLENQDVFIAHYDWRKPVSNNVATYLKPTIDRAKQETGSDKVDIVAHSMGGLLARSYIQEDSYENDIDQLVTLGTPHQGATDAYVAWEGGDLPVTWSFGIRGLILGIESALNQGQDPDLKRPISLRTFFPSLKDLLPIATFVNKNGTDIPPASLTEQNTFLQSLQAEIDELENRGIDVTAIVGTDIQTLGTVNISNPRTKEDEALSRWRDGHPTQDPITPNSNAGDQRVLAASAQIGDDILTLAGAEHEQLPAEAREEIMQILGIEPETFQFEAPDLSSFFGVIVLSPVDPKITCGTQVLSKNQNTFAEAQYLADPNAPDAPKILTVANPPTGDCQVTLTGTGSGPYHAITCFADSDQDGCTTREGTTAAGKVETYKVKVGAEDFKAPPEDIYTLTYKLWLAIPRLMSEKHLKLEAVNPLLAPAGNMYTYATAYKNFAALLGFDHATTKQYFNLLKQEFGKFKTALDQQISLGRLDATAILELTSLRDQLTDAGL